MFDDVPLGMHGSCTYIVEALTAARVRNHRTEMSEREGASTGAHGRGRKEKRCQ